MGGWGRRGRDGGWWAGGGGAGGGGRGGGGDTGWRERAREGKRNWYENVGSALFMEPAEERERRLGPHALPAHAHQ